MKFLVVIFAFAAVAFADVSHLNNMYLPPVHHGSHPAASDNVPVAAPHSVDYTQQAEDIPAAIGADTYTPAHLIEAEQEHQASNNYAADVPAPVEAVEEQQSIDQNTVEVAEETRIPTIIGANTYTPSHLLGNDEPQQIQPEASNDQLSAVPVGEYVAESHNIVHHQHQADSGIDTQYGSNGGYVY
ncbi:uncharacterized protein LOC119672830 [Teleopsis dalmanni]|uniref:uncharacterized protein LOC119670961 n=1 Tax=Teleopsis dalmanni TaxID=139649 RepID=UPI0018CF37F2|nr:uncharacterized protein LOC119670961 [Teleopsis dalmanni]XP_037939905.1 uncharacterized protein LOC119672830 [Teleopsis dalmanni]